MHHSISQSQRLYLYLVICGLMGKYLWKFVFQNGLRLTWEFWCRLFDYLYWMASWHGRMGAIVPPNFGLSENCRKIFLLKIFCLKMRNFGRKFSILGKYRGRIEILSTHNLFCEKFAAVCRKVATSCPPTTPLPNCEHASDVTAYVSDSDSIRVYI